jgi:hypothetical protein
MIRSVCIAIGGALWVLIWYAVGAIIYWRWKGEI